jgi:hypothetical protein
VGKASNASYEATVFANTKGSFSLPRMFLICWINGAYQADTKKKTGQAAAKTAA